MPIPRRRRICSRACSTRRSGLRGYLLTGHSEFLAPYTSGRQQVERALIGVAADSAGGPDERAVRDAQLSAVRAWQAAAENQIANSQPGHPNTSLTQQTSLKAMFDRFRSANAPYHEARQLSVTPACRARGRFWC